MKKFLLLLGTVLSCFIFTCPVDDTNSKITVNAETSSINDVLMFTENGLVDDDDNPLTVEGISFDQDTITYTFTNVNVSTTGLDNGFTYESAASIEKPTMTFVFNGANTIEVVGEATVNHFAFCIDYGITTVFKGPGSLTIDSKINLTSKSSKINEPITYGLQVNGTLEVEDGCTLTVNAGKAPHDSIGIYVVGKLINKGIINANGGTSQPTEFGRDDDFNYNGVSIGLYACAVNDDMGIYEQNGANSVLNATASANSYRSTGLSVNGELGFISTFKVTDGTVNAISYGSLGDNVGNAALSEGISFGKYSQIELKNAKINAETKSTLSNKLDEEYDYLEIRFCAIEINTDDDKFVIDNHSTINLTAPTGIQDGFIGYSENFPASLTYILEGEEKICGFGLEDDYPDDVPFYTEFELYYFDEAYPEDSGYGQPCFLKTPSDGTLTLVSKVGYYVYYVNNAIDSSKAEEVALRDEYVTKFDAKTYDFNTLVMNKTGYDAAYNELNTLKAEFDAKLLELRSTKDPEPTPEPEPDPEPTPEPEDNEFPIWLIIIIIIVLLCAIYVCGYFFLYKKEKLTGKFFDTIYTWFEKFLEKVKGLLNKKA